MHVELDLISCTVASLARDISTTEPFCLGCGTTLSTGAYRRLLGSAATRHIILVWREVLDIALKKKGLDVDEAAVVTDKLGFICRKCLRGFEAFKTSRRSCCCLLVLHFNICPLSPRRKAVEEELYYSRHCTSNKRPLTAQNPVIGTAPSVQVEVILVSIKLTLIS